MTLTQVSRRVLTIIPPAASSNKSSLAYSPDTWVIGRKGYGKLIKEKLDEDLVRYIDIRFGQV